MTVQKTDFPCDPMDGGCRALVEAIGELRNEKAGKKYVDEQMDKVNQKLDRMTKWLMATCVSTLTAIMLMLAKFALSLLARL